MAPKRAAKAKIQGTAANEHPPVAPTERGDPNEGPPETRTPAHALGTPNEGLPELHHAPPTRVLSKTGNGPPSARAPVPSRDDAPAALSTQVADGRLDTNECLVLGNNTAENARNPTAQRSVNFEADTTHNDLMDLLLDDEPTPDDRPQRLPADTTKNTASDNGTPSMQATTDLADPPRRSVPTGGREG